MTIYMAAFLKLVIEVLIFFRVFGKEFQSLVAETQLLPHLRPEIEMITDKV